MSLGSSEYCSATFAPVAAESAMVGGCGRCRGDVVGGGYGDVERGGVGSETKKAAGLCARGTPGATSGVEPQTMAAACTPRRSRHIPRHSDTR